MRLTAALALTLLLILGGCAHKRRDLYNPAPINVASQFSSPQQVRSQIRAALKDYQWIIEKDSPGKIVARQSRRAHTARIEVAYNSRNVNIRYIDSDNLNYHVNEQGKQTIHGTYNTWVTNVERSIASRLS